MAREKVKADGYEYKKGFSRSVSSSSSSGGDDHAGKKDLDKSAKRKHMDAEERKKAITNIKALIESTNDHIRIKQQRIQKLKTCNDFKQCDVVSNETTQLLKQKYEYEGQLAYLERKEAKSQWYKKKFKRKPAQNSSESHTARSLSLAEMLSKADTTTLSTSNTNASPASAAIQRSVNDTNASTNYSDEPSVIIIDIPDEDPASAQHSDASADTLPLDDSDDLF
jgi:hypothetical protein